MHDRTARTLSAIHTAVYRLTGGRIGRRLVDNDMLLLTTRGRKTGALHTVPLLYLKDENDLIVIASWGGRPYHPHWYANLEAHPQAAVQVLRRRWNVIAAPMEEDERQQWWPSIVAAHRGYAAYQARTDRPIPVLRLRPTE
ncbi:MAG: nitroreductase family deazaflavin-dependent oxidoreductase [Acidimicrobiia bacterium]|nr:nitroreductase family deazaflavin-dependent oxidoreductase [Acidimicrobiia bacterium]